MSVDATRILCRGVKKGWIEWLRRLKVEKNKQQKTLHVEKSNFFRPRYDILIHVSTAHLREMSTILSVSYPIEKLEASCTNETGHLLLTTSPRTRGRAVKCPGQQQTGRGQFGPAMSFPGSGLPVRLTPQLLSVGFSTSFNSEHLLVWF